MELLWITLESENTGSTSKQHAYIPKISAGGNKRNIALCGKFRQVGDDEKAELFDNMIGEARNEKTVCKSCLNAYKKLIE